MSRSKIQILIAVVLSLVLLVGVFSIAQGAALNAGSKYGQYHVTAGLQADLSRTREKGQSAQMLAPYHDSGKGGGCERSQHTSPDD